MQVDRLEKIKNGLRKESGINHLIQSIALADRSHFSILICSMPVQAEAAVELLEESVSGVWDQSVNFICFSADRDLHEIGTSATFQKLIKHVLKPLREWRSRDDLEKVFVIDASNALTQEERA